MSDPKKQKPTNCENLRVEPGYHEVEILDVDCDIDELTTGETVSYFGDLQAMPERLR